MRTLLDDVFDDLMSDINHSNKTYSSKSNIQRLEDLRDTLEDNIMRINDEIKYLEQDDSFARVDELIDLGRSNRYE